MLSSIITAIPLYNFFFFFSIVTGTANQPLGQPNSLKDFVDF